MAPLTPPQAPPTWKHTVQDVDNLITEALEKKKKTHDDIVKLPEDKLDFDNVFSALALAEAELKCVSEPLAFYQNVSPDKELRDASTLAEERTRKFANEQSMREDLYKAMVTAEANLRQTGARDNLSAEQKRLVEKMLLDGKRAGLALEKMEDKGRLKTLKDRLSDACLEFIKNINEENGHISFTREELDGVPEDVISGYTQRTEGDEVLYDVTFKTPDIWPVFDHASNPSTRKAAHTAHEGRLAANVTPLRTILQLRKEIAEVLQYGSWADYATEVRMSKSAANVREFLDELRRYLDPIGRKELEAIIALKNEDYTKRGLLVDDDIDICDSSRIHVENNLSLDESLVKEYFPVSFIVPAILDIYQSLLGVKFVEVHGEAKDVWHPDVQQFTVWEKDAQDESDFVGHCYLDLYPREAKFPHAAVFCPHPGHELPGGKRHYPVAAIVANLAKSTPERQALMQHFDLLSRTRYSRFHGTTAAIDFAEAPSQMLENWCWEPEVLKKMSSHYKTQDPLPDDLIAKIIKSRYFNVGLFYLRQVVWATFDLIQITHLKGGDQPGPANFGHIAGDYDVGYYGYAIWLSNPFASAVKLTESQDTPTRSYLPQTCIQPILLPGGSRDEMDLLKDFLGREPNPKAFINEIEQTRQSL
ncbi:mitochondrial endopeptidase [Boletus edulis]|nr:mitochondrial endopeptidase [Boletus edulis]